MPTPKKLKFKFIDTKTPEYPKELMLRWEVLRKPIGLSPGSEISSKEEEEKSFHFIAIQDKEIVGCVLFYPEAEDRGRLFQMAVSQEYRGRGFGRQLIHLLESELKSRGIKEVYLYARLEALGFYTKLGYEIDHDQKEGNSETRFGIPHQLLRKVL